MSYTTRARVESLMGRVRKTVTTLSDSTTVTADEVDDWIDACSAEVDVALLSQGYPVPVTSPASYLAYLDKLVAEGVAATGLKSWFQESTGPNSEGAWAVYERRWRDGIKAIRDRRMVPTALDEASGGLPDGYPLSDADDFEAQFQVGAEF